MIDRPASIKKSRQNRGSSNKEYYYYYYSKKKCIFNIFTSDSIKNTHETFMTDRISEYKKKLQLSLF